METSFIFIAGGLFILGIMTYVLFMVFLPEWVGITGKKALEAERSHLGNLPQNDLEPGVMQDVQSPANDVLDRMENVRSQALPRANSKNPSNTSEE